MFPDGTGAGTIDPYADTWSAGGVAVGERLGVPGGPGPGLVAPGPGADDMWPAGMGPEGAPAAVDGMPAYLLNPEAFVPNPEGRDPLVPAAPQLPGNVPPALDPAALEALARQLAAGGAPAPVVPAHLGLSAATSDESLSILYGVGVPLSLSAVEDDDGLIWKVACKTGTLALSPGPGQVDLDQPLSMTPDVFDDILEAYAEKAFPYVTIPETHGNGALENTGYVKAVEKLTKDELMADDRIAPEGKAHVVNDPEDTEYLMAGLGFTDAKAKQKAIDGSLPDVSVGIKSGYRHKRSGKSFKNALEHVALTPIPWIDGLIPFNPAMALGVQPYVGMPNEPVDCHVYTESLELSTEIRTRGDAFNPTATRAGLMALEPGDSLSWNWDVTVQRIAAGDADGTYYLVTAPESDDPDVYEQTTPTLYTDLESTMSAVTAGVAVCQQRKANVEAQRTANIAAYKGAMTQPAVASYSARTEGGGDEPLALLSEGAYLYLAMPAAVRDKKKHTMPGGGYPIDDVEDLKNAIQAFGRAKDKDATKAWIKSRAKALGREDLIPDDWATDTNASAFPGTDLMLSFANITFDPAKHKRDANGKFAKALGGLAPGGKISLPNGMSARKSDTNPGFFEVHRPTSKQEHAAGVVPKDHKTVIDSTFHTKDTTAANVKDSDKVTHEHIAQHMLGGGKAKDHVDTAREKDTVGSAADVKERNARKPENQIARLQKQLDDMPQGNANRTAEQQAEAARIRKRIRELNQLQGFNASADGVEDDDTLSLSGAAGSLDQTNPGVTMSALITPNTSVEALLAAHQAELEALTARLAETQTQLSAATQTATTQGETLHLKEVGDEIKGLVGTLPPSVLLAAQTVMLQDESWKAPGDEHGLNLSVQVPAATGEGTEERVLQTPTDVVRYMLSAMPGPDGDTATQLARLSLIRGGLAQTHLSAHREDNSPEAVQKRASDAYAEWEKQAHPERYDAEGKRLAA